jgi:hypothetical protein
MWLPEKKEGDSPFSCVLHATYGGAYRSVLVDGFYGYGFDVQTAVAAALQVSLRKAYRDVLDSLVSHGADVNPRDKDGGTMDALTSCGAPDIMPRRA